MRVRSLRLPVCCVLLRLAAVLWSGAVLCPARADIQVPIEAHNAGQRLQRDGQRRNTVPANGSPQSVKIHQGESVEIVLHGYGQVGKSIEFLIRSLPAHGTLDGQPRQLTRDTASISYVHRAGDGPGDDVFTYSVKSLGSAVSAAVPVTITVLDAPPSLAASPPELDFGTVKAGDSTRATLTLENRGGGVATGRVEPPVPWIVDGVADYHLARGETQSFQIIFQPSYGRSYVESAHFRQEEGRGVRLIGTGIGPSDPSDETPDERTAKRDAAETIARNNALARAAENAARPPAAIAAQAALANAAPMPGEQGAAVMTSTTTASRPPNADANGPAADPSLNLPAGGADSVVLNEAAVKTFEVRGIGTSTLDLAWTPPRPTPRSYRIELRYLPIDAAGNLRVDWRPWAKIEVRPTQERVTARVNGLPEGTRQYLRVVAVDDLGHLSAPSAMVMATTRLASTWWHVTPLKVLIFLLFVCFGLLIYRKWEERQIVRELDESRAARNADLLYKR